MSRLFRLSILSAGIFKTLALSTNVAKGKPVLYNKDMGTAIIFDTHAYVKKLKAVGFTEEQAEAQASTLAEIVEDKLATKRDIAELEARLELRLKAMESSIKADIIKWVAGMLVAQAAVIAALVKLL